MSDAPEIYRALDRQFGGSSELQPGITLEDVRRYVHSHVARLLDENPGLLMSILYRIDVAESDVQHVLENSRHEVIPERLADLIMKRQVDKLRTRRAYRDDPEP